MNARSSIGRSDIYACGGEGNVVRGGAGNRQLAHEPLIAIPRIVVIIQIDVHRGVAGGGFGPLVIERDGVALALGHEVRSGEVEFDKVGPTAVVRRQWRSVRRGAGAEIPTLIVAVGGIVGVGTDRSIEAQAVPATQPAIVKAGAHATGFVRREPG